MRNQTTLMTSHKGVDLHAATAARVMRDRLADGHRLLALHRAEYYTFWEGEENGPTMERLLDTGRYFNPNKHSYGHFELPVEDESWFRRESECRGATLPKGWPGAALATDLGRPGPDLCDRLLGGAPPSGAAVVDLVTFPLGEEGPLLGGVLWRLTLEAADRDPAELALRLAVTRRGRDGLLINPHMHGWLLASRATGREDT